jgi:site-specific recombinase XerD/DNA-binding CsgD family transcriptional regulator
MMGPRATRPAVSASAAAMSLTARQAEVLRLAGWGLSGKQIAHHLGISVRTVEDHFSAMRQRTGARSQGELIACGTAAGLVKPGLAVLETVIPGTGGRASRIPHTAADDPRYAGCCPRPCRGHAGPVVTYFREHLVPGSKLPGMTSENTQSDGSHPPEAASGNKRRPGGLPTELSARHAGILAGYAAALAQTALAAETRRTYLSRVRQYLAWLHGDGGARRITGDPLTLPQARDWAVRDYRRYLLREADPKRSVRYANNALAALDDFYTRLGMGKAGIARDDLPKSAPRALDQNAQIRWIRAVTSWPHRRDQALALLPLYAGLRIGDAVALDVDDVRLSARTGELVVFGKGGKVRTVPIAPQLRPVLQAWLDERRSWPGAGSKALFLNRRGGRLTTRGASGIFTAIGTAAGLDDKITAHVGRHTFVSQLVRGHEDLVLVAELAGHARLETLRIYSQPTDADKLSALRHLPEDR